MDTTKIRLSPEEVALINRADWILTKNNILQKVKQLFSNLQARATTDITGHSPTFQQKLLTHRLKYRKVKIIKGFPGLF